MNKLIKCHSRKGRTEAGLGKRENLFSQSEERDHDHLPEGCGSVTITRLSKKEEQGCNPWKMNVQYTDEELMRFMMF